MTHCLSRCPLLQVVLYPLFCLHQQIVPTSFFSSKQLLVAASGFSRKFSLQSIALSPVSESSLGAQEQTCTREKKAHKETTISLTCTRKSFWKRVVSKQLHPEATPLPYCGHAHQGVKWFVCTFSKVPKLSASSDDYCWALAGILLCSPTLSDSAGRRQACKCPPRPF